ncbi:MAG: DUF349 domain-containing protein [Bacteroidia bacterium]|nr:DUF349 domain-containing protein [Bacteroidia bacterium]
MEENKINELGVYNATAQEAEGNNAEATQKVVELPVVDNMSKEELLETIKSVKAEQSPIVAAKFAKTVKSRLQEINKELEAEQKALFLNDGGNEEDYTFDEGPVEREINTLINEINQASKEAYAAAAKEREQNLLVKQNILEQFSRLVESGEAVHKFAECRDWQKQWKETGAVPQENAQEVNTQYKRLLDKYYEQVKLDRDMRELDQKKNLKAKEEIIAQAEALLSEENHTKAFHTIQDLFLRWKEIGPVAKEQNEVIWEKFSSIKKKITDSFHEHIDTLKSNEQENYAVKQALCKELEDLLATPFDSNRNCDLALNKLRDVQERWRKAGFAPKSVSEEIFAKYRQLCDNVYRKRREFFKAQDAILDGNYKKKLELCKKAEEVQDSTDWNATSAILKNLQKEWKTIGSVPRKHSDDIWKRFRAACDKFFENKAQHASGQEAQYAENLVKKQALIEELKAVVSPEDEKEHLKLIKEFQTRWSEIGFVSAKDKDAVNKEFTKLIDQHFDKLHLDADARELKSFELRVDTLAQEHNAIDALYREREKIYNQLRRAESDSVQIQNNAGFFANADNKLMRDIQKNVDKAKKQVDKLKSHIKLIDARIKALK